MVEEHIQLALGKFERLIREQIERVERINESGSFTEYSSLDKIVIGICGGDGIGPTITNEAYRILRFLLKDEEISGRIAYKIIDDLTIESRVKARKAIPDNTLSMLKTCNVILKGPTTTPEAGDQWPNIESANVAMRKELDLFANVRPVKVPDKGIDWTFFRENTEGAYALGSKGFHITDDLALDFTVATSEGTRRIARLAYDHARKHQKKRVSIITKANVIKTTDGMFLNICKEVGKEYPEISTDSWYIDITTAKLIDEKRRSDFQVFILPNLYGDILTDEAAELQGGVGTAGSGNIGKNYAMFEAIHGSAPRMVNEGRAKYADPCSMLRAAVMLLSHIGYSNKAEKLDRALDVCMFTEKRMRITGRDTGCTCSDFGDYVMEAITRL